MSSPKAQTAIKAPIEPRLLTKAEAACYAGTSPTNYDRLRKAGLMPTYVTGMLRIDRRALDAAIDKLSNLQTPVAVDAASEEPDSPLTRWKKARDERQAAEAQAMLERVEAVTKPRRGGGVTTTYYYRPTGQRLPYNRKSLAFKIAFARCEEDAAKAAARGKRLASDTKKTLVEPDREVW